MAAHKAALCPLYAFSGRGARGGQVLYSHRDTKGGIASRRTITTPITRCLTDSFFTSEEKIMNRIISLIHTPLEKCAKNWFKDDFNAFVSGLIIYITVFYRLIKTGHENFKEPDRLPACRNQRKVLHALRDKDRFHISNGIFRPIVGSNQRLTANADIDYETVVC